MRGISKGGMNTAVCRPSIICPLCNKPAYAKEVGVTEKYKHFTKNGIVEHIKNQDGSWSRQRVAAYNKETTTQYSREGSREWREQGILNPDSF